MKTFIFLIEQKDIYRKQISIQAKSLEDANEILMNDESDLAEEKNTFIATEKNWQRIERKEGKSHV